ncbi:hypothetical protein [Psychromicrobium sp. YIM B11713]|uniref:hypothetical protein n=1 Tax=Psychromicrobium sp. YIM B11713 TaxID=3145233 RepID=UPI00374F461D
MTDPDQKPSTSLAKGQASVVGLASIVSAIAGYLVIWIVSKSLSPASNAEFLTFWSTLFFFFGVINGIQAEVTRLITVTELGGAQEGPEKTRFVGPRLFGVSSAMALGAALLVLLTAWLWGPSVLGENWGLLAFVLGLAIAGFTIHSTLVGVQGGSRQWNRFALLIASESTLRLVLVIVAFGLAATLAGFSIAAGAAAFAWIILILVNPKYRSSFSLRLTIPTKVFLRNVGHASLSTAASSALMVGFPILFRLTSSEEAYQSSAPLLLAIMLTRAPLMVPLGAFQSVAISHFTSNREKGLAALRPIVLILSGIGVVGGFLAYLIGPWLMELLFGPAYFVPGIVLAGFTLAAAALAILTITGGMCLAVQRHNVSSLGWILATVATFAGLWLPLETDTRAVVSLLVGPIIGILTHLIALVRLPK